MKRNFAVAFVFAVLGILLVVASFLDIEKEIVT